MAAGDMTMLGLDKKPPKAPERARTASRTGLALERFFTRPGVDPFSEVEWELRAAVIAGEDGRVVFEQRDIEVPRSWSQTATNVVVSKYFRGPLGSPRRESSVRQLIGRVVDTIAGWGETLAHMTSPEKQSSSRNSGSYSPIRLPRISDSHAEAGIS